MTLLKDPAAPNDAGATFALRASRTLLDQDKSRGATVLVSL
jgi:hypothetical protein